MYFYLPASKDCCPPPIDEMRVPEMLLGWGIDVGRGFGWARDPGRTRGM